jgi:hypothetical protein
MNRPLLTGRDAPRIYAVSAEGATMSSPPFSSARDPGARLLTTLVHALADRGGQRGIAYLCLGGGEAIAVAVEHDE